MTCRSRLALLCNQPHHQWCLQPRRSNASLATNRVRSARSFDAKSANSGLMQVCCIPFPSRRLGSPQSGCVGAVVGPAKVDEWTCELCENEETMEASIVGITSHIMLSFHPGSFFISRTTTASFALVLDPKRRSRSHGHQPIPSYEHANQQKDRAGLMSSVQCFYRS